MFGVEGTVALLRSEVPRACAPRGRLADGRVARLGSRACLAGPHARDSSEGLNAIRMAGGRAPSSPSLWYLKPNLRYLQVQIPVPSSPSSGTFKPKHRRSAVGKGRRPAKTPPRACGSYRGAWPVPSNPTHRQFSIGLSCRCCRGSRARGPPHRCAKQSDDVRPSRRRRPRPRRT